MTRRIKEGIVLFVFIITCFISQSFAQQVSKVAVIDSQMTFENSVEGKKALVQLREREEKIRTELFSLNSEIQALEKKLDTQKFTLSLETQQQIALDIDRLKTKYKRYKEDSTKEFRQLQFRLYRKITAEVMPIIEGVAKEMGFSIVFDLSATGVAYVHPDFDITQEVIRRYNASNPPKK